MISHTHRVRCSCCKQALRDVVRQHGEPDLFLTVAPWEHDFPFPYWLQKARAEAAAGCRRLAAVETLCIAHVLRQLVAGYCAGHTGDKAWTSHLLGPKTGAAGGVRAYYARYEFQESVAPSLA